MWKKPYLLAIPILLVGMLFSFAVILAQVQDNDPRDYYPETCKPGNNQWMRAPEAEKYILTRLNQWRIALGLFPLQRNGRLDMVASQQATFLAPHAPFGDDRFITEGDFSAWHTDLLGQGVQGRLERNGWPAYDNDSIIGVEIAAYFADVSGAVNFWQTSRIHNVTATRPGLREAGVYVMCWKGWLLQMVVMASRPNYVPVTYDPYTNSLFLGDESNSYLNPNSGFQPDFVQILDTGRNRLHAEEWLVWNEVLQLPENAPDRIILVFTDGVTLLETEIDINVDRTFPAQATPTPLPTITPTMLPTTGPTPTVFVPTPTLIPTVTPLPRDGNNYDVVIYYNEDFVSVVNESGRFANFRPLAITSNSLPPFSRSMTFFALPYVLGGGKLENFPPFYCVQAFSGARFTGPGKDPNTCVRRVSWRNALTPGERYWLRSSFEMTYGLEVVASCQGLQVRNSQSECGFDLPEGAFNSFSN